MENEINPPPDKNDENNTEVKKKQDKDRKKGEKKLEQFMKSISNLTPEEKIDVLCKRNHENYEEIRNFKSSIQILQRRIAVLEREKEQLQNEQSKGVLARSRLETLCRELQRQNKTIKDESLQKIREEEEKRKEVSNRFQAALNEVTQMMQQNTDKNLKLRDDNLEISNKFQKLCEQFKRREEEVTQLTKQMELEKQLAEATVKRAECQLIAEREVWNNEREQILKQLKTCEEEKIKLEVNLKSMEEHLSVYSSRYEEFESTITKSNQVFDSYKSEMSRMTKQVNKLEKDCNIWKDRWMQTQRQLNRIIDQKHILENDIKDREKKLECVSNLCRTIQEERGTYLRQLKDEGIEPKPINEYSPISNIKNNRGNKMTKKEKELHDLKKNVQALEMQLNEVQKSNQKLIETETTDSTNTPVLAVDSTDSLKCEPDNEFPSNSEVNSYEVTEISNMNRDDIASTLENFQITEDDFENQQDNKNVQANEECTALQKNQILDELVVFNNIKTDEATNTLTIENSNDNNVDCVQQAALEDHSCDTKKIEIEKNSDMQDSNPNSISEDADTSKNGTKDIQNKNDTGKKSRMKRKNSRSKKGKK